MSEPSTPVELLDLKMMPAWVSEPPQTTDYSNYEGEDERGSGRERRGPGRDREQRPRGPRPAGRRDERRDERKRPEGRGEPREQRAGDRRMEQSRPPREAPMPLPDVAVRFLPHAPALESVIAQIKSASISYSVFALARMFLDKPERYDVQLKAAEGATLHQLGENGPVATDVRILESGAFAAMRDEFYTVEQTQTEPLKGNFMNVARDRISGTLLGPTNHHSYQPQLRGLYEQRYSRRISFQDFQRQIEVVSDPAVVEEWKEQARSITTYAAKGVEPAETFSNVAEAERHFRQTHLPSLLRSAPEVAVSGVASRRLPDRPLGRVIEEAWSAEIRSPSKMMQELTSGLRSAGLNIFRHKRGMLFVAPIRTRAFGHDRSTVSMTINTALNQLTEKPGLTRKQLLEKLAKPDATPEEMDRLKMTLGSDLRWLISEGYVIEFHDGTLDLPRPKAAPPAGAQQAGGKSAAPPRAVQAPIPVEESSPAVAPESAETRTAEQETTDVPAMMEADSDAGGLSVEQSIVPAAETQEPAEVQPDPTPTEQAAEPQPLQTEETTPEQSVPSPS